jgi:2-polyprenyl-3-methyl-5-hydroxy-6-metoxy-1,4-benzoquinol methylase
MMTGDDTSDIRGFYDNSVDKEDGRLERHQLERDMTWRYLDKYLPRRGKILEIGCATGAYTIPLAKRGYNVTAVDFASKELDVCKKKVKEERLGEKVTCLTADARDLSGVVDKDFDVALLMGPLYHLILEEDRKTVLQQAFNHLKKGGLVFSIFISRYGIWNDVMATTPHYIEFARDVQSVIQHGRDADLAYQTGNFRAYFATPEEIVPFHERVGFSTITLAGIEASSIRDENYNSLKGKRREMWLDLLVSINTQPSTIGAANHILYIGKKEG